MNASELVTARHLTRKAIVYVRQSTPNQVVSHQESLRLQYALKAMAPWGTGDGPAPKRAAGPQWATFNLGWRAEDVIIIDSDLGP